MNIRCVALLLNAYFTSIVTPTVASTLVTAADLNSGSPGETEDKKVRFFDFMRPIVQEENQRILDLRRQLIDAKKNGQDSVILLIAKKYHVEWKNDEASWEKLLERVDAVPLELVLAQSANESNWGQSRFAKEGNNFFGQWCFKKGCGLTPKRRDKSSMHEVAKFNSINESVRSYLNNINNLRAYQPLRDIRRRQRMQGRAASADEQAAGLIKYSTLREEYVKEIRAMIRINGKLMRGIQLRHQ